MIKFKVGDKVRCIDDKNDYDTTIGNIYTINEIDDVDICIIDDIGDKQFCKKENFELVQEDKLPHELLGLPRYRVVKKDESDPLWVLFFNWFNRFYRGCYRKDRNFYGYDGGNGVAKTNSYDYIEHFEKNPTLITLQERDRCVNKKPSQTRKLSPQYSYQTQILRSDGLLFTKDKIGDELVSDIQARMNRDRAVLRKHKDLFDK